MPLPQLCWGRSRRGRGAFLVLALTFLTLPAHAVKPDEILSDPILETRARDISTGLRCLVCQNQSIDDSDATVARDLRILIREQLQQNKTDDEVVDFVVARYGEYVLLQPRFKASTLVLWAAPFLILLAGLLVAFRRKPAAVTIKLSDAEKAEIDAILRK
jgi:cytochrome c-type biogenesis protein CcmH